MTDLANNILAPIDSSKYMERNVNYACDVAKSMGAKLTFVHVVTLPSLVPPELPSAEPIIPMDVKPFEEAGSRIVEEARRIAKRRDVDSEMRVERTLGNPAQSIVNVAEEGKFDLIIIGDRGHSLLRNQMVGSVCDIVVRHAPCPVLVVR